MRARRATSPLFAAACEPLVDSVWRSRCVGYLASVDRYMNLQLASTEEWVDGAFSGNLGEVLIRCVPRP
eukprot:COSAG02_NODE_8603_length_2508_cov_2.849315_2_plen_69_part_00